MRSLFHRMIRDERGAVALEYGLIIALMVVVFLGALTAFAGSVTALFDRVLNAFNAAIGG